MNDSTPQLLIAWPRYDDPADLEYLFAEFGRFLVGRADRCLSVAHDRRVDGSLEQAVEVLRCALEQHFGSAEMLVVEVLTDASQRRDLTGIGLQLPRTAGSPVRQAFLTALEGPLLSRGNELQTWLADARPAMPKVSEQAPA